MCMYLYGYVWLHVCIHGVTGLFNDSNNTFSSVTSKIL